MTERVKGEWRVRERTLHERKQMLKRWFSRMRMRSEQVAHESEKSVVRVVN